MIIADIFETIFLVKDTLINNPDLINKPTKHQSISRRSKDAICYFPVLASRSISIEDITMVNKALERQFASYMRIAMGLDDVLDKDISKKDYINSFHNNKRNGKELSSIILKEDNKPYISNTETKLNSILESKINDIKVNLCKEKINVSPLKEDYLAPIGRMFSEADITVDNTSTIKTFYGSEVTKTSRSFSTYTQQKSQYQNQLLDNDVKKANELVPTTLDIELRVKGQENPTRILLGIKTTVHPINSEEMIFNVASAIREKRFLFRTIQWTSGEIKFLKDFVLSLDIIKKNVEQSRSKNSHWWRSLRVISTTNRIKDFFGQKKIIPNTTLVLSMDEVEYLANAYGINLLGSKNKEIISLINTFALLSVVIVDSSAELCYFFFDGDHVMQTLSFSSLERENRNGTNDMKALVSLLGR